MPRLSRRAWIVVAALGTLVAAPMTYLRLIGRNFPSDRTPEGAYLRIVLAIRDDHPEQAFAYLETEAQWAAISTLDYRKRAAARVRETYPEAEAKELLATLLPIADAADGPAVLAIEMKSLLIGESATPARQQAIRDALLSGDEVRAVIHLRTEHLGPDDLLVAAKVEMDGDLTYDQMARAIDASEVRVRAVEPAARMLFIEPDVARDPSLPSGGSSTSDPSEG